MTEPRVSEVELYILAVLMERDRYGLEIVEAVRDISDNKRILSLGTLYTTLHRMEGKKMVVSDWGESTSTRRGARRRYYSPTALGRKAYLAAQRDLAKVLRLMPSHAQT